MRCRNIVRACSLCTGSQSSTNSAMSLRLFPRGLFLCATGVLQSLTELLLNVAFAYMDSTHSPGGCVMDRISDDTFFLGPLHTFHDVRELIHTIRVISWYLWWPFGAQRHCRELSCNYSGSINVFGRRRRLPGGVAHSP